MIKITEYMEEARLFISLAFSIKEIGSGFFKCYKRIKKFFSDIKNVLGKLRPLLYPVLALFVLCIVSFVCSMRFLKVKKVKIHAENAPLELNKLRMLHISDIHNASEKNITLDIWKSIEKETFDIAFITGDMTVSDFKQMLPLKESLKELAERVPVFFVDGNHEVFSYEKTRKFLEEINIRVLENEKITIDMNGGKLEIIGLRDYATLKSQNFKPFYEVFEKEEKEGFRIVLEHQPQIIEMLSDYDNLLVLSGHTHGGQIRLPFMKTIYAPNQGFFPKWGDGLYESGKNMLYISRGIGTTIFPIRFFNRPEIAIIEIEV